jgi:hypothetical protein
MEAATVDALLAEHVGNITESDQGLVTGYKLFLGSLSPLVHFTDLIALFNRHCTDFPTPFDLRVGEHRTDSGHSFAIATWASKAQATAAARYLVPLCSYHEELTATGEGGTWYAVQVFSFPKRTA